MLEVNGEVLAALKLAPMSDESVDALIAKQNPPREWIPEKTRKFVALLQKQIASVPPR